MSKAIYTLLIATAITASAVSATQQPQRPTTPPPTTAQSHHPHRPTTPLPTHRPDLATDSSICPDTLNHDQLLQIKEGKLVLSGWHFKLHTSQSAFNSILPNKIEAISKKTRVAHITAGAGKGRAIIPEVSGRVLKCTYSYSTLTGKETDFAIKSEPSEHKKEPKGLTEAIIGSGSAG